MAKKSPEISAKNSFSQKIVLDDSDSSSIFQSEYEFKPVLSPPPEFFELRPVTNNLFQKLGKSEQSAQLVTSAAPASTSPAPETTSPVPEYAEEDYNNYTEASDNVSEVEEATAPEEAETQQNYVEAYQPLPVEPRHKRKSHKPVNTGIYSAFQRVTNVFDNLFVNR